MPPKKTVSKKTYDALKRKIARLSSGRKHRGSTAKLSDGSCRKGQLLHTKTDRCRRKSASLKRMRLAAAKDATSKTLRELKLSDMSAYDKYRGLKFSDDQYNQYWDGNAKFYGSPAVAVAVAQPGVGALSGWQTKWQTGWPAGWQKAALPEPLVPERVQTQTSEDLPTYDDVFERPYALRPY